MPSSAPMVITPVPPTPVTMISYGRSSAGRGGSGSGGSGAPSRETPAPLRSAPPCTVTKLGQNPSTQEKSLLHEDWSMARLRPKSVSSGTMATQFDFTPQSPHPSHTAGLMNARRGGSGNFPRLRLRRFSAAQVWS